MDLSRTTKKINREPSLFYNGTKEDYLLFYQGQPTNTYSLDEWRGLHFSSHIRYTQQACCLWQCDSLFVQQPTHKKHSMKKESNGSCHSLIIFKHKCKETAIATINISTDYKPITWQMQYTMCKSDSSWFRCEHSWQEKFSKIYRNNSTYFSYNKEWQWSYVLKLKQFNWKMAWGRLQSQHAFPEFNCSR